MQLSYSEFRQNLKQSIDATNDTREAIIITNHKQPKAVLLAYDDYCSLTETLYLLQNTANAKRLSDAVNDIRQGHNVEQHELNIDET